MLRATKKQIRVLREEFDLEDWQIAEETGRDGNPPLDKITIFNIRKGHSHSQPGTLARIQAAFRRLTSSKAVAARQAEQRASTARIHKLQAALQELRDPYGWKALFELP